MATIYRKTAKGQTEIETRALKLAPRFRSLLILVDGRRGDDELARLMPQAGAEALQALAQGGFIEAIGLTAEPAPPAASAPPPRLRTLLSPPAAAEPAAMVLGFEQRRREAAKALVDTVGPMMAESLALKMERARSADELQPLIDKAAALVAHVRGRAAAADYVQRYGGG